MVRLRRFAFLFALLVVGTLLTTSPARAQETGSVRYAFSDTTLLRDTLGLRFPRLFPLSDSLQILPDTLRALSIRYLWSLERLVTLADSLGVPVDSVGPVLQREQAYVLNASHGTHNSFSYNTGYTVGQTQSAWTNTTEYGLQHGPVFMHNSTTVELDRYRVGALTSVRQSRLSATELGWRFSPDFSLGGRVGLERLNNRDPTAARSYGETTNEYQISMRSRQRPVHGMTSDINLFSGLLDINNVNLEKRGVSGNLGAHLRYSPTPWLAHELNGAMDGNLSRTRAPGELTRENTRDYSQNVRGTLSLFQTSAIGLKGSFNFRHVQVETPSDSGGIHRVLTDNWGGESTVRLRQDNDRYVDLGLKTATAKQATVLGIRSRNSHRDDSFTATGRYLFWGWAMDGHFSNGFGDSKFPARSDSGGYGEFQHARSADATFSRQLGPRILARVTGSISLTSYRYSLIGKYTTPPVSRDQWRQSWRADANYSRNERFSTGVALDVSKNKLINIPSASTGSNNNTRSYRAEWHWTCRLLEGLTATQRNTLSADYLEYPFSAENNRLTLDYAAVTTLNAIMNPRLSINVTHNSRRSPAGNYTLYPDGLAYFARSDETGNAALTAAIAYTPSPAIAFSVEPAYFSSDRSAAANGVVAPQRANRSLSVSAGANINWSISKNGLLRGDIHRAYRADRTTTYSSGLPQATPRSQIDFWTGSLQLSWHI